MREVFVEPPHDRDDHDRGADVRDDEQQFQQSAEQDPLVVPGTRDEGDGVVEHGDVEQRRRDGRGERDEVEHAEDSRSLLIAGHRVKDPFPLLGAMAEADSHATADRVGGEPIGPQRARRLSRPVRVRGVVVAVFGDAHGHAEALDAVIGAAEACDAQELWSLGDMIGRGPDPEHVVTRTRERCAVALMGNHDYGATGSAEPTRFGEPGSPAVRSIELARDRLSGPHVEWMRSRKPAARRGEVQLWHGGPRNAVHEYVGASNAAACLAVQRAELGLVGHTHVAAAWRQTPRGAEAVKIRVGEPLDLAGGQVATESRSGGCASTVAVWLVERA